MYTFPKEGPNAKRRLDFADSWDKGYTEPVPLKNGRHACESSVRRGDGGDCHARKACCDPLPSRELAGEKGRLRAMNKYESFRQAIIKKAAR